MKKIIILILIIGCLLSCHKPTDLYTGRLVKVEYFFTGGMGSYESWVLTFEDGHIWTVSKQPYSGFKLGELFIVYKNKDGYLRVRPHY